MDHQSLVDFVSLCAVGIVVRYLTGLVHSCSPIVQLLCLLSSAYIF